MQKLEKSNLRKIHASYKKSVNMFSVQFCELVSMKIFVQHLLTSVLTKYLVLVKSCLKMAQNHEIDKMPGGFLVFRYHDRIFVSKGLQGMLSTPPKPFDFILHTGGKIKF